MKKILIAIEREKFTYLFKFNEAQISTHCVIDLDYKSLTNLPTRVTSKRIESALPFFESEDEVILLEYLKDEINLNEGLRISFSGVLGIIPISDFAYRSLKSRLNQDFNIYSPLREELSKDIKRIREDRVRISAVNKILSLLNLQTDNSFLSSLRGVVIKIISNEGFDGSEKKVLKSLIKFDLTPSFIPSGNSESFLKLGCITLLVLGADINDLQHGSYYRIIIENKNSLNQRSIYKAYLELERIFEFANSEDKERINKVKQTLNSEFNGFNSFLSYYIYLSLNRLLKDKDYDLTKVETEIDDLYRNCPIELAYALSIFGYVHSFDRLYESIHRLSNSPLFKTSISSPVGQISIQNENETSITEGIETNKKSLPDDHEESEETDSKSQDKLNVDRVNHSKEEETPNLTDNKREELSDSSSISGKKNQTKNIKTENQKAKSEDLKSVQEKTPKVDVENAFNNSDKEGDDIDFTDSKSSELPKEQSDFPNLSSKPLDPKNSKTGNEGAKLNALKSTPKIPNTGKTIDLFDETINEKNAFEEPENNYSTTSKSIFSVNDEKTDDARTFNLKLNNETYKELNHQSIDSLISKFRFRSKKENQQRDKLLYGLNNVIKQELINGDDSFNFQIIKAFILSIVDKDPSLKGIANKITDKLENEYKL